MCEGDFKWLGISLIECLPGMSSVSSIEDFKKKMVRQRGVVVTPSLLVLAMQRQTDVLEISLVYIRSLKPARATE